MRRRNILRGIRGSLNRFLSILFIVALGAGFLAGLFATTPDMEESCDRYMDETRWYDIDVKSSQGFTREDAAAVAHVAGVEAVQPARVMDMVLTDGGAAEYTARVYALFDQNGQTQLCGVQLLEGRMPQSANECVLQSSLGRYADHAVALGDTLRLMREDRNYETLSGYVSTEELTVVGIARSPMSISVESESSSVGSGSIGLHVFVPEDFYTFDFYTDVYVSVAGAAAENAFTDAYTALIDPVADALETLGESRAAARTEALRTEAQGQIDEAQSSLDLFDSVAARERELAQDAAVRAAQTAQVAQALAAAQKPQSLQLAALLAQTAQNVKATLEAQQTSANDSAALFAPQREALEDAKAQLAALEDGFWLVRTREDAVGFASYKSNVEKVAALCKVFPVFFFLVALLVALTTMTRLVEERRTEIGTLKALGFSDGNVLGEYLFYSLLSSALGCALGFAVGFRLFPAVISNAYGMMYVLPAAETPFRPLIAFIVAPVTVGGILLATLWACYASFRSCPAQLMVPKAPAAGKRIWLEHLPFVWNRLSFTRKVTCRNLFRYKKRFLMTVIGLAGCSALLVTGFGLRDSIHDIVEKQFGEIDLYDLTMVLDDESSLSSDGALRAFLEDDSVVVSYLNAATETGRASFNGKTCQVTLNIPRTPETIPDFITLRERKTGSAIPFGAGSAVLTEKMCEDLGVKAGDVLTLENADGKKAQITVTGVCENYLAAYAYISPDAYETAFGKAPNYKTLLVNLVSDEDMDGVMSRALSSGRVLYTRASRSIKDAFADTVKSIDAIVLVLILSAGILSMVVLYNLTNVNICERKKELATLRVLGFYERETERYIFRETNFLSVLGTFLGLFVGIWLHSFIVRTVEVDMVMFGRSIYPLSFVYAFVISMLFTFLVNRIMSRSIRKVDMVESMKAND